MHQVGVIGFCMGGALSLGSAVKHPEIDACVAFYGWNDGLADVSTMTKPVSRPGHMCAWSGRVCDNFGRATCGHHHVCANTSTACSDS